MQYSDRVCFISDDGEMFTWGKAGPFLGYEAKGSKQTAPKRVDFPEPVKVVQVACGVSHTLGEWSDHVTVMWLSHDVLYTHSVFREWSCVCLWLQQERRTGSGASNTTHCNHTHQGYTSQRYH